MPYHFTSKLPIENAVSLTVNESPNFGNSTWCVIAQSFLLSIKSALSKRQNYRQHRLAFIENPLQYLLDIR